MDVKQLNKIIKLHDFHILKALWDGQSKIKMYYGMSRVKKQLSGKRSIMLSHFGVTSKKIILRDMVEEIKKSGFHSVSEDKVTSSNDEILSLCFRFVDENMEIKEKLRYFWSCAID